MSIGLDDALLLVGRLDDAPGFDTPRERFRRFLLERVVDVAAARTLIADCQRSIGEQRHRALQDLVVLLGRSIGFDVAFGAFGQPADGTAPHAQWRSPGLLTVILEVRTDQTTDGSIDDLARTVSAASSNLDGDPRIGLCVVARQYAARHRLASRVAADARHHHIRVVSVESLLALAARVESHRMSHEEVVKLLRSDFALDFVITLLDRPAAGPSIESEPATAPLKPQADRREPAFWVATINGTESTPPDRFLRSVVAHRRLLGISPSDRFQAEGAPGDWVCFFIAGRGIVGHAQLMSVVDDAAAVVRNASRFSRVYRLSDVTLYDRAIVRPRDGNRSFTPPPGDPSLHGSCLAPIARQDFLMVTTNVAVATVSDRPSATG